MSRGITFRIVIIGVVLAVSLGRPTYGSVSRLSYSRPGAMMRVPMSTVERTQYLFSAGFVSEIAKAIQLRLRRLLRR
ncbi:hypothetical protein ACFL5M_03870 [Candidatus Neomarinimicrobiota bacterium]